MKSRNITAQRLEAGRQQPPDNVPAVVTSYVECRLASRICQDQSSARKRSKRKEEVQYLGTAGCCEVSSIRLYCLVEHVKSLYHEQLSLMGITCSSLSRRKNRDLAVQTVVQVWMQGVLIWCVTKRRCQSKHQRDLWTR